MLRQRSDTLDESYRVFLGGLLSGGARVFSRSFLNEIVSGIPKIEEGLIVGGEMEGVGLLSVSPRDEPLWIVAKGICDFANRKRDRVIKTARPIACRNRRPLCFRHLRQLLITY